MSGGELWFFGASRVNAGHVAQRLVSVFVGFVGAIDESLRLVEITISPSRESICGGGSW